MLQYGISGLGFIAMGRAVRVFQSTERSMRVMAPFVHLALPSLSPCKPDSKPDSMSSAQSFSRFHP